MRCESPAEEERDDDRLGRCGAARPPRDSPAITLGTGTLLTIAIIAVVGSLCLARAFFVPLLTGILASYALRPVVDMLKAWRIPRAVGAALVPGVLVAALSCAPVGELLGR